MERVKLTCSNCGGTLNKIETQKDTYICLHCGNKEIIKEEATSTNYFVNQTITKNIFGNEKLSEEDYFKLISNAEKYIKIKDYKRAINLANQAVQIDEGNYLAWWISTKAKLLFNIENKQQEKVVILFTIKGIEKDYQKAYNFAEESTRNKIEQEYNYLYRQYSLMCDDSTDYVEANFEPADINKAITGFSIGMFVCFAITLALVILMIVLRIDDMAAVCVIMFIVGMAMWGMRNQAKVDKKLIEYIKTKEQISFHEIMSILKHNSTVSEKLQYKVSDDVLIENLNKRISKAINQGYLTGYKIEKDYVVRVKRGA